MVGTALFVLAIAFISYSEIKRQFDDAAIIAAHQTASEPVTSWTDYEVGIGPNQPLGQHLGPGQALHSAFRWWCWFSEHPWSGLSQGSLPNGPKLVGREESFAARVR